MGTKRSPESDLSPNKVARYESNNEITSTSNQKPVASHEEAAAPAAAAALGLEEDVDELQGAGTGGLPRGGSEDHPHTPEVQDVKSSNCRMVDEFEKLGRLGEGAYGVVYKAKDKRSEEIVALKKIKMHNQEVEGFEGFPVTSLREINLLISLRHPSIVDVKEVVIGKDMNSVFMVMEFIDTSLKDAMAKRKEPLEHRKIKRMMYQLLDAVAYMHDNWVLHRDLKPSNILVSAGEDDAGDEEDGGGGGGGVSQLKICDFGLARRYDSPIKVYTHDVVTMWYRAPELLSSQKDYKYTTAIDVWSLGCIMAELVLNEPLFPGTSEIDQLRRIKKLVFTAHLEKPGIIFSSHKLSSLRDRILYPAAQAGRPMLSEEGLDLLSRLLAYDPTTRISAKDALKHPWFDELL